jgi:mono/diheme cytochrome c family protein
MGGATQAVPIAKIKSAGYVAGKSVMLPFAAGFSDAQLADIVRYLQTLQ